MTLVSTDRVSFKSAYGTVKVAVTVGYPPRSGPWALKSNENITWSLARPPRDE